MNCRTVKSKYDMACSVKKKKINSCINRDYLYNILLNMNDINK